MFHRKVWLILVGFYILLIPLPVAAQNTASAVLTSPETGDFPRIQSYLEVFNHEGGFVHNLKAEDITIFEDQKAVDVLELEQLQTGAQFVVALNLGPTFAIRDSQGISRFQTIQAALVEWATQHNETLDDLSFLTNDGPEYTHLEDASQWLNGFQAYQSDPRAAVPSLDVLIKAINIATDPTKRVGMGRAILLLTPPPDRAGTASLQSLIAMAHQEQIQIHIWMVSSQAYFTSEGASQLAALAEQTGGKFFAFSGTETLPRVDDYLEPLRYVYKLQYESKIRTSETHQIYVQINTESLDISSETQSFELNVSPPNPIFLSPPQQIFRANRSPLNETLSKTPEYTPEIQTLKILIEFPDGKPRPIQRTTLYIDGQIADENSAPPFDTFTWNLKDYTTSGTHSLQVEVLDTYGLSNLSIETPIQITVQQTPQSILSTLAQNAPVIAGAAVAVAGGILLFVLIVGRRIQPKTFGRRKKKNGNKRQPTQKDPVTQSVPIQDHLPQKRLSNWINHFSWPHKGTANQPPPAYFEVHQESQPGVLKTQIPIFTEEITFGKDPTQATTTFNDASVNELHARLKVINGEYRLYDEGTVAGTWINYAPIPPEGVKLSHGDIIHLGRVEFRFKLTDKNKIPRPIVIPQEKRS